MRASETIQNRKKAPAYPRESEGNNLRPLGAEMSLGQASYRESGLGACAGFEINVALLDSRRYYRGFEIIPILTVGLSIPGHRNVQAAAEVGTRLEFS